MRLRSLAAAALLLLALGSVTPGLAAGADGLTMEAQPLLGGHARVGSWMAIGVHLRNDGPPIQGELRLAGGAQGRTRFGTTVDLPTQSDKTYVLYAQPPAFGRDLEIALVSGNQRVATTKAQFTVHDAAQPTIAVVAEKPGEVVSGIDLIPNQNAQTPTIIQITPEMLPDRVEAWGSLDRIIWQDVDSNRLTTPQLAALQDWIAAGGRLVIVGGTAGPSTLAAFPDTLMPYRPISTIDVAPSSLSSLIGAVPAGTADVPALAGDRGPGRVLATSGDRVVAAELPYGNGSVTVLGFDPTAKVFAGDGVHDLWRRLLPSGVASGSSLGDDTQLVSAVSQLPALALPPIEGLIVLLGAYILLVGPINYLVLKRLDRREWAWFTMPLLIGVFAVGAYAFGAVLRGSDVLVNEVAIVRGAPGTTDGTAQVYVGLFSPSRGTYQVRVPGGALLSAPISADFFGGDGTGSALDVLQGDPARVRDLAVSFGSLRTIRAETAVSVPLIDSDLHVTDNHLQGTIRNASSNTIEKPAIVLGSTVVLLDDLAPGASAKVDAALSPGAFGQQLSDRVVGPAFFGDATQFTADRMKLFIRHSMIDQLTMDPNFGVTNQLSADGPVILGWGSGGLLPVEVTGQTPKVLGNVLYYLPTTATVTGKTTFRGDLMRSTLISSDANFFGKDPYNINFGRGTATMAYRPIGFDGTLTPSALTFALNWGPDQIVSTQAKQIDPLPTIPPSCNGADTSQRPECGQANFDGMPSVELYDLGTAGWVRLPKMDAGVRYQVGDPTRYVDPKTGSVLVRFVNDRTDSVGFNFDLAVSGDIR